MKAEELLKDESFLAWYSKSDPVSVALWENRRQESQEVQTVMEEAVILLMIGDISEIEPSDDKLASERARLMEVIERDSSQIVAIRKPGWMRWVAAACLLLLVGTVFIFNRLQTPLEYMTAEHEIKEILLPDSTVVSLNQHSHIKLLKVWTEEDSIREVWLDGEAYFSVQRTTNNSKFIVHSGDLKVEVLGTTFNVKKQAGSTTVVLETGKVQLISDRKPEEKVIMEPGQMVEYKAGELTQKPVNTQVFTAWKEGKIIFENATITEVVRRLGESYGLAVDYSALQETEGQFNGSFPADDLDVLLSALSKAYPWQIERQGKKIIIRSETSE